MRRELACQYDEGLQEGIEKGKVSVAKKMKEKGLDVSIICELTGLSLAEIEKL